MIPEPAPPSAGVKEEATPLLLVVVVPVIAEEESDAEEELDAEEEEEEPVEGTAGDFGIEFSLDVATDGNKEGLIIPDDPINL